MTDQSPEEYRCGFVAIAGRPNVGKSTLVNRILGQELCIVTRKAQTTRNRITAIHNLPHAQLILLDTPGIHDAKTPLNLSMVQTAMKSLEDADAVLFMTTPSKEIPDDDRLILESLKESNITTILAINKIDKIRPPELLPIIETYSQAYDFKEIFPISALYGASLTELIDALIGMLPPGPPLYPLDDVSDLPVRFFVAEMIREQVTMLTGEEIPYKTAVVVESFKERGSSILIHADIHIERASQKKILVGKGGKMIKRVGIAARKKIEEFLGCHVRLELFVKVTPHWTRDDAMLGEFGYQPR
ncbi:GTPase Era [Thermodesulfobacteriota bacterium]